MRVLVFMVLLAATVAARAATTDSEVHGFIRRDVKVIGGSEVLKKGEELTCQRDRRSNTCCFEGQLARVCIALDAISTQRVSKIDLAIDTVAYSDAADARIDACAGGKSYRVHSDAFKWSYGVRLRGNTPGGRALIRVAHFARRGSLLYELPEMTKVWTGGVSEDCRTFVFTKEDVARFLETYQKTLKDFVDAPLDLNLIVTVKVTVLADSEESNYKNNEVTFEALLPVNSTAEWPPERK